MKEKPVTQSEPRASHAQLEVILAGHNGDLEVLRSGTGHFSPETLSAAYARISRFPEPVPVLRQRARDEIDKARKSNRTIVFGLGHHSVAEHAVLNFDILGCSRLAIEALEWHRLCSYTEKSQRYITLDGDYVVPPELAPAERERFAATIARQNQGYAQLLPKLQQHQAELHPEMLAQRRDRTTLEGWAKEDARYVVALATAGQLGFTCNARNLELIVRRLRQARLQEVRQLGELLFERARQVVPSLIILADEQAFETAYGTKVRDEFFRRAAADLAAAVAGLPEPGPASFGEQRQRGAVTLVDHSADPDAAVIAGLLFTAGRGSLSACCRLAAELPATERRRLILRALAHLSEYDSLPRAFEEAVFRFELIVDASALAQLKRHRLSTQHWGPYDPDLGFVVPKAVAAAGETATFSAVMEQTAETYRWLSRSLRGRDRPPEVAAYVLTNAHRRRVSLTMNLRELYHFSRLREDGHAQWAIRQIAGDMSALVRQVAPATALLLGGKDSYEQIRSAAGEPAC